MEPQDPNSGPPKKSSALSKAFELLKAKKAAAAAAAAANASNASPLTKLNSDSTSSVASNEQSNPVITNVITYSFPSEDGSTMTVPLAPQFLPPRSAQTGFLFATHMVLNVPVSDPAKSVQRDYVAYVFKLGTIFIPGNAIISEWKTSLPNRPPVTLTFFHDDLNRKSYNATEVTIANLSIRFLKPGSAVELLRSILSNQSFFVQESAFSRVYQYFQAEYKGVNLITYARFLLDLNDSVLNVDASLLVAMVRQTQEELEEVQVMANEEPNQVKLWNDLEQLKIDNKEGLYAPLTVEQEDFIQNCPTCLTHFQSLTDRIQHWQMNSKCKNEHLEDTLNKDLLIGSAAIQCKTCKSSFDSVWQFCLHRDSHRFRHRFHVCIYCTQLFPSVQSFAKHHCTALLNTESIQMVNDGVPDLDVSDKVSLMTCPFCNEEPFPLMNSLIIHLFISGRCFRQFVDKGNFFGSFYDF